VNIDVSRTGVYCKHRVASAFLLPGELKITGLGTKE
jgi:hypothetical protein